MPSISHIYLEKLRQEVIAFEQWLSRTQPQDDGTASTADLLNAFTKANSIYLKALALYRTTADEENGHGGDEPSERILSSS